MFKKLTDRASRALRSGAQAVAVAAPGLIIAKLAKVDGISDWSGIQSAASAIGFGVAMTFASAAWYSLFPPKGNTPQS